MPSGSSVYITRQQKNTARNLAVFHEGLLNWVMSIMSSEARVTFDARTILKHGILRWAAYYTYITSMICSIC